MIVDCHTHINCFCAEFDEAGFVDVLEKLDSAFVLTMPEDSNDDANSKVIDFVKSHSKAIGFAVVNPLVDKIDAASIKGLKDQGFKGIVLYCPEFEMHPCHSKAFQLYESVVQAGMPIFFHNGGPFSPDAVFEYTRPYLLDEVARSFPDLKIVIGNLVGPYLGQALAVIAKNPNVYGVVRVDPSKKWELYNSVLQISEAGIEDKLFFGSGYPFGDVNECVEALLGFNRLYADTQLPTVQREKLRGIVERDVLEVLGIED